MLDARYMGAAAVGYEKLDSSQARAAADAVLQIHVFLVASVPVNGVVFA